MTASTSTAQSFSMVALSLSVGTLSPSAEMPESRG